MKPGSQGIFNPKTSSLLHQDEESGLERVLGIVRAVQQIQAHPHNHGAVPFDECCESQLGRFAVKRRKPIQQLRVRQIADNPYIEKGSDLPADSRVRFDGHVLSPDPPTYQSPLEIVMPLESSADQTFSVMVFASRQPGGRGKPFTPPGRAAA